MITIIFRRKNGKWSVIDYSLYCGQDLDNMCEKWTITFIQRYVAKVIVCS